MADALRGSMDAAEYKHVVLGRVYEYFLSQFASAEGKKGGEFYTPRCVVKVLVEMLEPYRGRVYDPCCGSSGMFVQSVGFIRAHASGNGNGGKVLFIDARKLGRMVDRTHRELTEADIARIAGAYHAWRDGADAYEDLPGFCKSAALDEVRQHGHVLTPGRYVGAEPQPDDGEPFEAKMGRLVAELQAQQAEGARLDAAIAENPNALGFAFPRGGPMTVSELIETLKAHPGDLRIVVNGYEEGYDDLSPRQISVVPIVLNTGVHDWEGRHGEPGGAPGDAAEPSKVVDALVLRRVSN